MFGSASKKSYVFIALAGVVLFGFLSSGYEVAKPETYHSMEEVMFFNAIIDSLPQASNSLFTGSGRCGGCHGHDPNENGSITEAGWDVNPTDMWRATMMANSAKDPFWKAKVAHEVAVNPDHQVELEDKCTSCHAPMGHFAAKFDGAEFYSMEMLHSDTVGLDGVSCGVCHQLDPDGLGTTFSGELAFITDTIYGPYGGGKDEPPIVGQPMEAFVGYEPLYGAHIKKSELCAGCHTLITNTVDLEGEATGNTFVEQATYHEWLNSVYSDEQSSEGRECQQCHFPEIDEEIVISANYIWLDPRTPYGLHYMVGGNTFMLELMKNNIDTLNLAATEANFDSTIQRTMFILQNESATLSITDDYFEDDSITVELDIVNLTGHKFPSGYPSRRAFVEFIVTDEDGNTVFESGVMDDQYEVIGQDPEFETHYDLITEADQVLIYEQVMGDVNDDVTTVLERADHLIKDNRLTPKGFSTSHFTYDTTLIAGAALTDSNFNYIDGEEGSGSDRVTYRFPTDLEEGDGYNVSAKLYYQSAPPKWNEELFSVDDPLIDHFEEMYWETGADPVLIASDELNSSVISVEESEIQKSVVVYPNPLMGEVVTIDLGNLNATSWILFDSQGKKVNEDNKTFNSGTFELKVGLTTGTYFLILETDQGTISKKILKL